MVEAFESKGAEVKVVVTEPAKQFLSIGYVAYDDEMERDAWKHQERVLHIELRDWADCLVIAPLSANTLAKMTNGMADNLVTCVHRAWDYRKPVFFAPAMNTQMWDKSITRAQIDSLLNKNYTIIEPQEKELACGEFGIGGMAEIEDIVEEVRLRFTWAWPLNQAISRQISEGPGAFGAVRKHDIHTGVDLYCKDNSPVYAVENGMIVDFYQFTGEAVDSPWWNDTWVMVVEGPSGYVLYGELRNQDCHLPRFVSRNTVIGNVAQVLNKPPKVAIEGHSLSMLHIELHKTRPREIIVWKLNEPQPENLLDPTPFLKRKNENFSRA